jgi:hypothetical protein
VIHILHNALLFLMDVAELPAQGALKLECQSALAKVQSDLQEKDTAVRVAQVRVCMFA